MTREIFANSVKPSQLVGLTLEYAENGTIMGRVVKDIPKQRQVRLDNGGYIHYTGLQYYKIVGSKK
jgi:hypothetical protein